MDTALNSRLRRYSLLPKSYKNSEILHEWSKTVLQDTLWEELINVLVNQFPTQEFFIVKSTEERDKYFHFGISCFLTFVQVNYTGPPQTREVDDFHQQEAFKKVNFIERLSLDNEDVNVNLKYPELLVLSQLIFEFCGVDDLVNLWWMLRSIQIHQEMLDGLNPTLLMKTEKLHSEIDKLDLKGYIRAELSIELAQLYQKFRHVSKSKILLDEATELLGLQYELVGKLGKRTKYQENELAQLACSITLIETDGIERPDVDNFHVPKNLCLDDDVRLDQVQFSTQSDFVKLPNTEQKLILSIINYSLICTPRDELKIEELSPLIDAILSQISTYSVRVKALLLRCKLESNSRRTIERCLKQSEDIITYFKENNPHPYHRVFDVFGAGLPPIWKVEAQYAEILLNLGLVKNSLDVYLRIKAWEEVIVCYTILNLRHKAADIIKEQLEVKETPKLMCLLGDATDDVKCYEKAWDMSNQRSYRAQRHWGMFLFVHKEYETCIPHFEKSVEINPLQPKVWLRLGYAALQVENWKLCSTAYRRYTTLEPESFEAWNNLAQACIKLDNKVSAHQAILEALKCTFDNWKVWENLLLVSCDIGRFHDVVRAYHKLLDLKEKYLNVQVLTIIVANFQNVDDGNEQRLLLKIRELFGRLTSVYPNEGALWELYAEIAPDAVVRVQRLQRAYRGYTKIDWYKDLKTCNKVLAICNNLVSTVLDNFEKCSSLAPSVKLNLSSAVAAAKKSDWVETEEIQSELKDVISLLETITNRIKSINS